MQARVVAVDVLRGLVMALMTVDHARSFLHEARFDPLDPAQTTVLLYATRWVTHLCAPVFVFLAGLSAALSAAQGKPVAAVSRDLLCRGLLLVALEFTVVRFGWYFNFDYHHAFAQVIWAIGWSMVALAALVRLPLAAIATTAAVLVFGHNALDPLAPADFGRLGWLWTILHESGGVSPGGRDVYIAYPLLPWIGVMAGGFAFGPVMLAGPAERRRRLAATGAAMLVLFLVLRGTNLYGNPTPWTARPSLRDTVMAVLDCQKYPPSLAFLLMTLGPSLLLLAWMDRASFSDRNPLLVFGRAPLFFYLVHIPLIHLITVLAVAARGRPVAWLFANPPEGSLFCPPADHGFGLAAVYAATALVLAVLYPACAWWARLKARHPGSWLRFL